MILVADASVLVGELLRRRGRELINHTELHLVVAEHQWSETEHELERRLIILTERGRITTERRAELEDDVRRPSSSRARTTRHLLPMDSSASVSAIYVSGGQVIIEEVVAFKAFANPPAAGVALSSWACHGPGLAS